MQRFLAHARTLLERDGTLDSASDKLKSYQDSYARPIRHPLERLARQGRRFPAHPALVHPDHPVQVDPGRPVLAVPPARADGHKVALAVVVLAG